MRGVNVGKCGEMRENMRGDAGNAGECGEMREIYFRCGFSFSTRVNLSFAVLVALGSLRCHLSKSVRVLYRADFQISARVIRFPVFSKTSSM